MITPRANLLPVPSDELARIEVCGWCRDEVEGVGRIYFDSLEAAFEHYKAPLDNRPRYREVAATYPYDKVWIPRSGSYIAIGRGDERALAFFGKGYIETYERGTEELANYGGTGGAGTARSSAERPELVCPVCQHVLPATGVCDDHGRPNA